MLFRCYVLDFESVWMDGEMYPKEFAYMDFYNPLELHHYVIKPPPTQPNEQSLKVADVKRNNFLYHNFHHLSYESGDVDMNQITFAPHSRLYVYGPEKTLYIQNRFPHCKVFNIIITGKLSVQPLHYNHIKCPLGAHSSFHCAVIKLYKLYGIIKNTKRCI